MHCPNCGTEVPDNATFCPSCGTSVASYAAAGAKQAGASLPIKVLAFVGAVVLAFVVIGFFGGGSGSSRGSEPQAPSYSTLEECCALYPDVLAAIKKDWSDRLSEYGAGLAGVSRKEVAVRGNEVILRIQFVYDASDPVVSGVTGVVSQVLVKNGSFPAEIVAFCQETTGIQNVIVSLELFDGNGVCFSSGVVS